MNFIKFLLIGVILLLILISSGCSDNSISENFGEDNKAEPVVPDPIEEAFEADTVQEISNDEETDEHEEQMYVREEKYKITVTDDVVNKINSYERSYQVFEVQIIDHLEWAENFVKAIKGDQLDYKNKPHPAIEGSTLHTLDQSLHYWQKGDEFITYNVENDNLIMRFKTPVSLPGILINPRSREEVKSALDNINRVFFSSDFQIEVDEIYREGDFYRIDYVRILNGLPIYTCHYQPYLLITPDGKIKGARFLLAEFNDNGSSISIISGEDLRVIINTHIDNRSVYFDFVDPEVHKKFDYFYGYDITGNEEGEILIEEVDLFYYYLGKFVSRVVPTFFFAGSGFVEIEDEIFDAKFLFSGDAASK